MIVFMSGVAKADTWDGTAAIWTHGSGTESDPYLIESAANLAWIAEMVNGGVSTYSGQYFKMTTDIDLNSLSWTGIGTSEDVSFQGTFDGDGHSVSGINTTTALFNVIKNATIRNLSTAGTATESGVIRLSYGEVVVSNCHSSVNVTGGGNHFAGGIVNNVMSGTATITNCSNAGTITTSDSRAGGIVANSQGECIISDCRNTGDVHSGGCSGGIIGRIESSGNQSTISKCFNKGKITRAGSVYDFAGGIVGGGECDRYELL